MKIRRAESFSRGQAQQLKNKNKNADNACTYGGVSLQTLNYEKKAASIGQNTHNVQSFSIMSGAQKPVGSGSTKK